MNGPRERRLIVVPLGGARAYLDAIRARPEWRLYDARVAVEMGKPAETILEFAKTHKAAFIVIRSVRNSNEYPRCPTVALGRRA